MRKLVSALTVVSALIVFPAIASADSEPATTRLRVSSGRGEQVSRQSHVPSARQQQQLRNDKQRVRPVRGKRVEVPELDASAAAQAFALLAGVTVLATRSRRRAANA